MRPYKRSQRLRTEILRVLSEIFQKDIDDPRLQNIFLVRVEISEDLRQSKIFYSSLKEVEDVASALENARGYIKTLLSQRMEMRRIPDICFEPVKNDEKDTWLSDL